jgi:hypothetical protein
MAHDQKKRGSRVPQVEEFFYVMFGLSLLHICVTSCIHSRDIIWSVLLLNNKEKQTSSEIQNFFLGFDRDTEEKARLVHGSSFPNMYCLCIFPHGSWLI